MPTRFYLRPDVFNGGKPTKSTAKAAPAVFKDAFGSTGTPQLNDYVVGVGQSYGLHPTPSAAGTANTTTIASAASTSAQVLAFNRWASMPLTAQTIAAQTWTLALVGAEVNAAANMFYNVTIYVYRPGTGAVVGFIIDQSATTTNSTEISTNTTNPAGRVFTVSGSAVTAQVGDQLVLEVWMAGTQSMATSYNETNWFGGTTVPVNGTGVASATDVGAYLEATNNIVTATTVTKTVSANVVLKRAGLTKTTSADAILTTTRTVSDTFSGTTGAAWRSDVWGTAVVPSGMTATYTQQSGNGRLAFTQTATSVLRTYTPSVNTVEIGPNSTVVMQVGTLPTETGSIPKYFAGWLTPDGRLYCVYFSWTSGNSSWNVGSGYDTTGGGLNGGANGMPVGTSFVRARISADGLTIYGDVSPNGIDWTQNAFQSLPSALVSVAANVVAGAYFNAAASRTWDIAAINPPRLFAYADAVLSSKTTYTKTTSANAVLGARTGWTNFGSYTAAPDTVDWSWDSHVAQPTSLVTDSTGLGGKYMRIAPLNSTYNTLVWYKMAASLTQEVRCKFRFTSGSGAFSLWLSFSGSDTNFNGVEVVIDAASGISYNLWISGAVYDGEPIGPAPGTGTGWWMAHAQLVGTTINVNVWPYGTQEPTGWNAASGSSSFSLLSAGRAGVGAIGSTSTYDVDFFSVANDGLAIPRYEPQFRQTTASAVLRTTQTRTTNANAVLLKTGATKTASANAVLKRVGLTKTVGANAILTKPISKLFDRFDSLNAAYQQTGTVTAVVSGGAFVVTMPSGGGTNTTDLGYYTMADGESVVIQVVTASSVGRMRLVLQHPSSTSYVENNAGSVNFILFGNATNGVADTGAWWRLRRTGDNIAGDTSPDGQTWTNQYAFAGTPTDYTVAVQLYTQSSTTDTFRFDNLNVFPRSKTLSANAVLAAHRTKVANADAYLYKTQTTTVSANAVLFTPAAFIDGYFFNDPLPAQLTNLHTDIGTSKSAALVLPTAYGIATSTTGPAHNTSRGPYNNGSVNTLGTTGAPGYSTTAYSNVATLAMRTVAVLHAQTIPAQTWTLLTVPYFTTAENSTTAYLAASVYVYRPSTNALVGYIYDSAASLGAPAAFSVPFPRPVVVSTFTGAAVTAQEGDVLVIERWLVQSKTVAAETPATLALEVSFITPTGLYASTPGVTHTDTRSALASAVLRKAQTKTTSANAVLAKVSLKKTTFADATLAGDITKFYDQFSGASVDVAKWNAVPQGSGTITVSNGAVTLNSGPSGSNWAQMGTQSRYYLDDGAFSFEVVALTMPSGALVPMFLNAPTGITGFQASASGATITVGCYYASSQFTSFTFDPVAHRWLRIRRVAATGVLYAETAPDAETWTVRGSTTGTAVVTGNLFFQASNSAANTILTIDNVNAYRIGRTAFANALLRKTQTATTSADAVLTGDVTRISQNWNTPYDTTVWWSFDTVSTTNTLQLGPTTASARFDTFGYYRLQNGEMYTQFLGRDTTTASVQWGLRDAGAVTGFQINNGGSFLPLYKGSAVTGAASHPTTQWLRMRQSGTTLYWDVSADNSLYTNIASKTSVSFVDGTVSYYILAGGLSAFATFDNFNTYPRPRITNADAILYNATSTTTRTTSADAVLRTTRTLTVGTNAVLKKTQTTMATATAILRKTQSVVANATAVLRASRTTTVATNAILRASRTVTVGANAYLWKRQSATANASAVLRKTRTVTASADAVLRTTQTLTVASSAVLRATQLQTAQSDAVLRKTQTVAVAANAYLAIGVGVGVMADAVLRKAQTLTTSADAYVAVRLARTANADALLQRRVALTAGADARLQAHVALTATASAVLQTARTCTTSASAVLTSSRVLTVTTNAVLRATRTVTVGTTAVLRATTTATTHASAVLQQTMTRTAGASAVLRASYTTTTNASALLRATRTYTVTADGVLRAARTRTATADAVLQRGALRTVNVSAVLQRHVTVAATASAVLRKAQTLTVGADAYISIGQGVGVMVDAVLKQAGRTRTTSASAVIAQPRTKTTNASAVLRTTRTLTVGTNAVLRRSASVLATASAVLRATRTKIAAAAAVLKKLGQTTTATASAVLSTRRTTTTGADARLYKRQTMTAAASAVLRGPRTLTVGANAVLKTTGRTQTVAASAVLTLTRALVAAASAVLRKARTASSSANAVLQGTRTRVTVASAILRASHTTTSAADAILVQSAGIVAYADAVLITTSTRTTRASAVLVASGTPLDERRPTLTAALHCTTPTLTPALHANAPTLTPVMGAAAHTLAPTLAVTPVAIVAALRCTNPTLRPVDE